MMQSKHGTSTGLFGLWLTDYLRDIPSYQEHIVFYDHGNKQKHPNVAVIKGFIGRQVRNANRLTDIDIMVVNADKEAVVLIEIEEGEISPKKLLGDVFAALLCTRFAVRVDDQQEYFTPQPETRLIIAGVVPSQGGKLDKFEKLIKPRLQQLIVPHESIRAKNIDFVFGPDVSSTIEVLTKKMQDFFPKE